MDVDSYQFGADDLATLILRRFYPERTDRESTIIRDFLLAHGQEYDRYEFSLRVGQGQTPDPAHPANIQRGIIYSTRKRIDALFWRGDQSTLIEIKERIGPGVLGQLQTYAHLLQEDRPGIAPPILAAVGRYCDDDTRRVLTANGIEIYLYAPAEPAA